MMNESEWNDRHDQEHLEKLQKAEEQLETLLANHLNTFAMALPGKALIRVAPRIHPSLLSSGI
jgi:hypothetical protein